MTASDFSKLAMPIADWFREHLDDHFSDKCIKRPFPGECLADRIAAALADVDAQAEIRGREGAIRQSEIWALLQRDKKLAPCPACLGEEGAPHIQTWCYAEAIAQAEARGRAAGLEEAAKHVDTCAIHPNGMPYFPSTADVAARVRALSASAKGEKK